MPASVTINIYRELNQTKKKTKPIWLNANHPISSEHHGHPSINPLI